MRSAPPLHLPHGCEYRAKANPFWRRSPNVHKALNARLSRRSCDFGGRVHVHRMKSVTSVFNIETDRVDNSVGTGNGCLHGTLVMCVRGDLLDSSVLAQPAMPRDCAHSGTGVAQMAHDTTANKAGPAKHACAAHSLIRQM